MATGECSGCRLPTYPRRPLTVLRGAGNTLLKCGRHSIQRRRARWEADAAPGFHDTPVELGAALEAAHLGKGRPWLRERIAKATGRKPGGDKARRLLALGRETYTWLTEQGYTLCDGDGNGEARERWQTYTDDVW